MDWNRADPLSEIDQRISVIEADRDAWQHQLEDAVIAKVRAGHLTDAAQAAEDEARRHVREDTSELAVLRAERRTILPDQRVML